MRYANYRGVALLQNAALVQKVALLDTVSLDLVKQRSQTHAEHLGGSTPVATARLERGTNGATLRVLHRVAERRTPHSPPPSPLRNRAGSGTRSPPKILRPQSPLVLH